MRLTRGKLLSMLTVGGMTAGAIGYTVLTSGYDLSWNTSDAGGETFSVDGDLVLGGTIGQVDANPEGVMTGGTYSLEGGFWPVGPKTPSCGGDANGDGVTSFYDLVLVLSGWGPCPPGACPADIDGSGIIDFRDLAIVLSDWDCGVTEGEELGSAELLVAELGVSSTKWTSFLDVVEFGSADEADRWSCWMQSRAIAYIDGRRLEDIGACPGGDPIASTDAAE